MQLYALQLSAEANRRAAAARARQLYGGRQDSDAVAAVQVASGARGIIYISAYRMRMRAGHIYHI